ncbi:hypothetical protein EFR00_07125 [Rhizobium sophoriradicis]|nr:hypothetical protein EFR00_07125 [Rhizobium sophoriradicis]
MLGLLLSIASLALGLFNAYITWQNRRLALKQDARKVPALTCYLSHGFQKTDGSGRAFSLLVQVRNPSDTNNAIANAELAVRYLTKERVLMTLKLPANRDAAGSFVRGQDDMLSLPVKVPAHEVVSGWLHFRAPVDLLSGMAIDGYELEITDTHEAKTTIAPNLMQEYRDEVGSA